MKPSIESLEGKVWGEPEFNSSLVLTAYALRKKPLDELTPNELRVAFNEDIGASFLKDRVLELLQEEPAIDATYYEGDLLLAVMRSRQFSDDEGFKMKIAALVDRALTEISDVQTRDELQKLRKGDLAGTDNSGASPLRV